MQLDTTVFSNKEWSGLVLKVNPAGFKSILAAFGQVWSHFGAFGHFAFMLWPKAYANSRNWLKFGTLLNIFFSHFDPVVQSKASDKKKFNNGFNKNCIFYYDASIIWVIFRRSRLKLDLIYVGFRNLNQSIYKKKIKISAALATYLTRAVVFKAKQRQHQQQKQQ